MLVRAGLLRRVCFGRSYMRVWVSGQCWHDPWKKNGKLQRNMGKYPKENWCICLHCLNIFCGKCYWMNSRKALGIILDRFELITFRFAYGRDRILTCSWLLDFWTRRNPYLWIWIYQVTLKHLRKHGNVFKDTFCKSQHFGNQQIQNYGQVGATMSYFVMGSKTMGFNDGFAQTWENNMVESW